MQEIFAAQTPAHVMQTQYQLATLKKGIESITSYFYKVKMLVDALITAGKLISPSEFSIYLLVGLGTDYDTLVTSLTTRPDPLSPHQIYSYLLNHESCLNHQAQTLLSGNPPSGNLSTTKPFTSYSSKGRGGRSSRQGRGCGPQNYFTS